MNCALRTVFLIAFALFFVAVSSQSALQRVEFTLIFNVQVVDGMNQGPSSSLTITTSVTDGLPEWNSVESSGSAFYSSISTIKPLSGEYEEAGNITFSTGNTLYFSSQGYAGQIWGNAEGTLYGSVRYQITGGEGLFLNASGAMTDVFTKGSDEFQINVWGVCWVPTTNSIALGKPDKDDVFVRKN